MILKLMGAIIGLVGYGITIVYLLKIRYFLKHERVTINGQYSIRYSENEKRGGGALWIGDQYIGDMIKWSGVFFRFYMISEQGDYYVVTRAGKVNRYARGEVVPKRFRKDFLQLGDKEETA